MAAACAASNPRAVSAEPAAEIAQNAPEAPAFLITSDAVGPVRMGMTIGEVLAAAPEATVEHEPYFSGEIAEAECFVIAGERIACVTLGVPFDRSRDVPVIDYIFTASTQARTAEGVGPGSPLTDAVAAYGKATATISIIESREYVEFENPPGRLSIRIGAADEDVWRVGIYENDDDSPGATTTQFRDDAVVMFIEL